MRCERMHATISIATCVANQENRMSQGMFRRPANDLLYAGCKDCPTGAQAARGELNDDDLKAVLEKLQNRFNPPADVVTETVRSEASGTGSRKQEEVVMEKEAAGMEGKQKQCSRCKQMKPLEEFLQDKKARDGHRNICLECNRAYQNDWAGGKRKDSARSQPLKGDPQNIEQETAEPQRGQPTPAPDMANGHASRLTPHPKKSRWSRLRPKRSRLQPAPQNEDQIIENQILLDFSCYPEVLKEIKRIAHHEERPPEVQARFMLRRLLQDGWGDEVGARYEPMFLFGQAGGKPGSDVAGGANG